MPKNQMPIKVLTILGTRPEAIKLGPVVSRLRADPYFISRVCFTSQHDGLLKQVARSFAIEPDYDLQLMTANQTLHQLTSKVLLGTRPIIEQERPDVVIVQGDTTTAFASSLSAFYLRVPLAHVEAGLRTGNMSAPYPEEANRVILSRLAAIHFCPTAESRENLLREQVAGRRIIVTGNTVIDALRMTIARVGRADPRQLFEKCPEILPSLSDPKRKLILVTVHRREQFGPRLRSICQGIRRVAERTAQVSIVCPVHPNPNVREPVREALHGLSNVHLIEPLDYEPFVYLLSRAFLVLTDSGGIQEEAPALGKPVLVVRDSTERPEAVAAGAAVLVGSDPQRIENECTHLITDDAAYSKMSRGSEVFGDGRASERIVEALRSSFRGTRRSADAQNRFFESRLPGVIERK
jgi:UDP-N-acetylglucosamine 2-epimerase (non-hydrolysing)